jgi:hypothetical protein
MVPRGNEPVREEDQTKWSWLHQPRALSSAGPISPGVGPGPGAPVRPPDQNPRSLLQREGGVLAW